MANRIIKRGEVYYANAKCEQVRAVDVERLLEEKQGSLSEKEMAEIDKKLMVVLDLVKYLGQPSKSKWRKHSF